MNLRPHPGARHRFYRPPALHRTPAHLLRTIIVAATPRRTFATGWTETAA
jgi:hypothetical protein